MGKVRHCLRSAAGYLAVCAKWLVLAALVGCVVGPLGTAFGLALNWANATRAAQPWLLYLLPIAGLVIVFLYSHFDPDGGGSTNQVFVSVREHKPMTLRTAPLIFLSTIVTHLVGGSAGREGAALQLGGSMSAYIGRKIGLDAKDGRMMVMCGMAAAFSALFGTPMTAAIFAMEVVSVGVMYYAAMVPCLVSAMVGLQVARFFGLHFGDGSLVGNVSMLSPKSMVQVGILGVLCALLSILFCKTMHTVGRLYAQFLPDPRLRAVVGGCIMVALSLLDGGLADQVYNGAGGNLIEAAVNGNGAGVAPWAFLVKILFTTLTLGAGFRGGEIVPTFACGATFGCVAGPLIGLSPSFGGALGTVAAFCGVTNCPLSSILLAYELFGGRGLPLFALAIAVSYRLSGYTGLYSEQQIVYSKIIPRQINKKAE